MNDDRPVRGLQRWRVAPRHVLAALLLALLGWAGPARADELPDWSELEAAGARVGKIHVVTGDVFDTDDPAEDWLLFRWVNALHRKTRPAVIRHSLLFRSGERLSTKRIEETERLLRSLRYLYDVQIRPLAWHDGIVDIEVRTRDTWSLNPGFNVGRSGGRNSSGFKIDEYNLLGTGTTLSWGRSRNVDRSSSTFRFAADHIFGTWTALDLSAARNSDGRRHEIRLGRPFYSLDTRWAAGLGFVRDDRIDTVYNAGEIASEFHHRERTAEVWAGWSRGLRDGWVQRLSIGASTTEHRYAPEPGRVAPPRLPVDERLAGPFVRYELIEDHYERLENRNLIARPEFFALGLAARVQLGWASRHWDSTQDALLWSATVSRGVAPRPGDTLIAAATVSGRYTDGKARRQRLSALTSYYRPQGKRAVFYASARIDALSRSAPTEYLLLGGDTDLRGYPLRYQAGQRRAIFTVEERFFTDIFIWRLFRVGGAAFFDIGRAWGGDNINVTNPGWLRNVGLGLRIASVRSAFSNVLHVDLAFPLDTTPDIHRVQLLVRVKTSF